VITENSPKKFKHTITDRLYSLALDVIGDFYLANEVYV
jgi:hypothetical protein